MIAPAILAAVVAATQVPQRAWNLDDLGTIGGFAATAEGSPRIVDSPYGRAIQFDGADDSIFVAGRPLVGASQFTIEAVIRPEGGDFEQRFLHVAETDPASGFDSAPTGTQDRNSRIMFELRVVDGHWYVDAFIRSSAGSLALAPKDKLHPLRRWYALAQTYDGTTYRVYVDGVLQMEGKVPFIAHGPGNVRIGARMNRISYFNGTIAKLRFTSRALDPGEFLRVSN